MKITKLTYDMVLACLKSDLSVKIINKIPPIIEIAPPKSLIPVATTAERFSISMPVPITFLDAPIPPAANIPEINNNCPIAYIVIWTDKILPDLIGRLKSGKNQT